MPAMSVANHCLLKETVAQLKKEQKESESHYPITVSGVTVGLCRSPELPPRVVLPAGLQLGTASVAAEQLLLSDSQPPNIIAVRFRVLLGVDKDNIEQTVEQCRHARLITIDGTVLGDGKKLSDVVAKRGVSIACDAVLFVGRQSKGDVTGLSIAYDGTTMSKTKQVAVDTLVYCDEDATREVLANLIATGVQRVLTAAKVISDDMSVNISHYALFGDGIAVTVVTPAAEENVKESDSTLSTWRLKTQEQFVLPLDRPYLRKLCRVYTIAGSKNELSDGGWPGRLADVHHGIKGHGLGNEDVTTHLVQGRYLYSHYMQDRFNDSGWGCAYRSLQTLFSWCAFERYTQFDKGMLPSHKDIQRALVDVGDKPPSFFGSKEWIGANEVCYALEKLTGVSSKILHVSKGSEMEGKGRELARHFDEWGSPVMVGGGVLAWTILGVARNEKTGRTKFLILDPHYEGRDDLSSIQNKGWVAWKSADVFKADAFYNLCMPLRPSEV